MKNKPAQNFDSSFSTSGTTSTPWLSQQPNEYISLNNDVTTNVCIIGAGVAGLSIAYQLAILGQKVVVIDAGLVGSGETGRSTAHLTNAFDNRYHNVVDLLGADTARLVAQSHSNAIDYIEDIVRIEKINCDFSRVNGYLFLDRKENLKLLEQELKATQEVGLDTVKLTSLPLFTNHVPQPVLVFPRQAQFHPMQYLAGLAKAICNKGGQIFVNTPAIEITEGKTIKVKTKNNKTVTADHVVVATNAPIFDKSFSFSKQTSNRTYAIATCIPKYSVEQALYWDTADPYHYVRTASYTENEDLLIIGGADHRSGKACLKKKEPFLELESWMRERFPQAGTSLFKWSGQVQEPTDYLAYIGRVKKNSHFYIATGDSGNGITHGAIAGMLISDLIMQKMNLWEAIYSPKRTGMSNKGQFFCHNLQSLWSYTDHLTPGEVASVEEIKPDEGAIIRRGIHKIAVYRDQQGNLHECSAVCTHMKAPLHWNAIEKSWDCPAHGSRFDPYGKIIQSPASKPLAKKINEKNGDAN